MPFRDSVNDLVRQMEEADAEDDGGDGAVADLQGKISPLRERRATLSECRDKLEESGRGQSSLTDLGSRAMRSGRARWRATTCGSRLTPGTA